MRRLFRPFAGISEERKSTLRKFAGWAVAAVTVYLLVSVGSYLFTWKLDQSLLSTPDMLSKEVSVHNWGGKTGYELSHFLVSECFGLGAFALIFLLGVIAYRMIYWKKSLGTFRIVCLSLTASFLISLLLSYVSVQFTDDPCFGGGLGGDAGTGVNLWLANLIGSIPALLVILLLVVGWLILASSRFEHWFASIKVTAMEAEEEDAEETEEAGDAEEVEPVEDVLVEDVTEDEEQ